MDIILSYYGIIIFMCVVVVSFFLLIIIMSIDLILSHKAEKYRGKYMDNILKGRESIIEGLKCVYDILNSEGTKLHYKQDDLNKLRERIELLHSEYRLYSYKLDNVLYREKERINEDTCNILKNLKDSIEDFCYYKKLYKENIKKENKINNN